MRLCDAKHVWAPTDTERRKWKRMLKIVKTLGKEGMSSDESDIEERTNRPVYRVRVMLWRRDLDNLMDAIDNARFKPGSGYSKKGSKPTPRIRDDRRLAWSHDVHAMAAGIKLSSRDPVYSLPRDYYNDRWFKSMSKEFVDDVLCLPRERHNWVRYLAEEQ
jgi:hypothetical protein